MDIDRLLQMRSSEPPSPQFAERIIAAALAMPQRQSVGLWTGLRTIFAEAHLPNPSFAAVLTLLVGLLIGFSGHMPDPHRATPTYLDDEGEIL